MSTTREPAITVIDTFGTREEAEKYMHRYARNLRRLRKTHRYGVTVEQRVGVWYVCLADRGP